MAYTARWGPKGFLVSANKVVPFLNFTTSVALKADSENDTSGTAPTNTRGRELQPMTFSTTYLRAAGVDPRAQFEEWVSLIGEAYPLYIEEKLFGPARMKLTRVDLSDVNMTNSGAFLLATVNITMEEYSDGKTSKLADSSATRAAATYEDFVTQKKAALNATASTADKAAKKPIGTRGHTL